MPFSYDTWKVPSYLDRNEAQTQATEGKSWTLSEEEEA